MVVQNTTLDNSPQSLSISAFKDITAFVLETAASEHLIKANIKVTARPVKYIKKS
ncbi:MAG: hypothetical protein K2X04_07075 [Burkholderiales bacterium]|nr:hypothetical protein [Burkholderiales bacterium]